MAFFELIKNYPKMAQTKDELDSYIISKIYDNTQQLVKGNTAQDVLLKINEAKAQVKDQLFINPQVGEPPLTSNSQIIAPTSWVKKVLIDKKYSIKVQEVDLLNVTSSLTITPQANIDVLYIKNVGVNFTIGAQVSSEIGSGFKVIIDPLADVSYFLNPIYNTSGGDLVNGTAVIRDFQWLHTKNKFKEIVSGGGSAASDRQIQVVNSSYDNVLFNIANDDLYIDCDNDATAVVFKGITGTVQSSDYNKTRIIEVVNSHATISRSFTLTSSNTVWDSSAITTIAPNSVLRIYAFISLADNKLHLVSDNIDFNTSSADVVQFPQLQASIEIKKDTQVLILDGIDKNITFTWENGRVAGNPIKIFLRDDGTSRGVTIPNVTQLGNQISLNVTMPISTIPSEWHALDLVPLDNSASSVLMTSYVTESGEYLREFTESHDLDNTLNPVTINVNGNTTILYLENIKTNVTINFGTEFPNKEIKVFLKGTAGNTVTFANALYKGWNNDYFNSNVFTLDEEKSLSVDVDCYLNTVSISDWRCEGKTVIFTQPIKRAYYSEQLGNDSKAKLNDPNKPFATHTAAYAAIGTLGANERGLLEILPSYIDNTIDLANNIDIHFQAGCVIRLGSIRDIVITGKNISITGFPKVNTSTSLKKVFEFTSDISVRIQVDSVPYCDSFIFMSGNANVKMTTLADIYGNAQDAGYVITYRDNSKLDLNVAGGTGTITGNFFAPIFGRRGTTLNCSANVIIRAKNIVTLTGTSGSYQTVVSHDSLLNANILIASDLEYKGSIFTADRTAVLSLTNTNDAGSKVRVEGKITAGVAYGIGTVAANGAFNIEVEMQGKQSSSNVQFMATWQGTTDNPNGKILLSNGSYREGLPSIIGRRRKIKLKNIEHINTAAANPTTPSDVFICQANSSASNKTSIYLDGSNFYTNDGNASKLISGTASTLGVELTCVNATGTAQIGLNPDRNAPDGYNELRYSTSEF